MPNRFKTFVIFAEMRTGSNFLETNLNALEGVCCHGEAFNPHFIGYPSSKKLLGFTQSQRDKAPVHLLEKIRKEEGLNGFRYFHDHDPRVLDDILADEDCAKIILTRSAIESYVSWKIARSTGQWKLTDVNRRRDARPDFDPLEFAEFVGALDRFRNEITQRLQATGQTAFQLDYADLRSLDVINGLAAYLGASARLEKLDQSLKVQNPEPLSQKVTNPKEMAAVLNSATEFDLDALPDFEPRRVASVPSYITAAKAPLLFLPIRGGPTAQVNAFLAALDGVPPEHLPAKLSQRDLRQWKRARPGHRSFTVIRHPLLRAHHVYCAHILGHGKPVYGAIRQTLVKRYGLLIPEKDTEEAQDISTHRAGFAGFLEFLKGNIAGQTAIRVDAAWCTQAQALQGFANFALPDMVIREEEMHALLPDLASQVGVEAAAPVPARTGDHPFDLSDIYDDEIERLAASAYQRDYMIFGFERWQPL